MLNSYVCECCPRQCKVNRENSFGYCKAPANYRIGRIAPHEWEEPIISGEKGSGAIFFAGCNMGCVFCQNMKLSRGLVGQNYSSGELVAEMLKLQDMGCHNINLVTPSHYVPWLCETLKEAKDAGLAIPIVYNTSAYDKVETLKMLDGLVDIYLPDFKYFEEQYALRYSNAKNYKEVADAAIAEMVRQTGKIVMEDGLLKRGVVVRHLVMPGLSEDSKKILKHLFGKYENQIFYSIMNQFTPYGEVEKYPEINRTVTQEEYDEVVDFAISLGVENGFIQEGETQSESFIPEFS